MVNPNELSAIVTNGDQNFRVFISNAIDQYYKELSHYIQHNQDIGVFDYATERSIVSLFVNGLIRNDAEKKISAIQEYRLYNAEGKHRRPDIFIKNGETAIWIECKYDSPIVLSQLEWDVENWLKIENLIYQQVHGYYEIEGSKLNDSFKEHYIMTLNVKPIRIKQGYTENPKYDQLVVCSQQPTEAGNGWYYSDSHRFSNLFNNDDVPFIEVCGSFKKMKAIV